jgi:isopentenyl diphosphate isomerase/L-lactate dehydrogenase-like FMN-dependent dehydrogenase
MPRRFAEAVCLAALRRQEAPRTWHKKAAVARAADTRTAREVGTDCVRVLQATREAPLRASGADAFQIDRRIHDALPRLAKNQGAAARRPTPARRSDT